MGVCRCCCDCCSPAGPSELAGLFESAYGGSLQGTPATWFVELMLGELSGLCGGGEVRGEGIGLPTPSLMACRAFRELLENVVPPPPAPELPG